MTRRSKARAVMDAFIADRMAEKSDPFSWRAGADKRRAMEAKRRDLHNQSVAQKTGLDRSDDV